MNDNSPVPLAMKIRYGAGMFGCNLAVSSTGFLLLYCYTDVFGIAPAAAGFVIFIGSLVDVVGSLAVPWLTGKVRSPIGRYRPFLIYGSLPLGVFVGAMFIKPSIPQVWLYPFVMIIHLLYRASYSAVFMPHASLLSRLSHDADERAAVGAVKAIASNLGVLTVATLGMTMIDRLGGHTSHAFTMFGITFGAIITAAVFISGMTTRERVTDVSLQADTTAIWQALKLMARNHQMQIAFAATLLFFIGYAFLYGGAVYYFKYVIGNATGAKYAALGIALGGIMFPPAWAALVRRTSKAIVWSLGCGVLALAFIALYLLGPQPLPVLFAAYVVAGIGKCAVILNYFSLTADAVDYGQWRLGSRVEAYSFGVLFLMTKIGESIGSALLGLMLAWAGLVANQLPTLLTISRLRLVTCLVAAAVLALSAIVILFFRIDARRHRALMNELRGTVNS